MVPVALAIDSITANCPVSWKGEDCDCSSQSSEDAQLVRLHAREVSAAQQITYKYPATVLLDNGVSSSTAVFEFTEISQDSQRVKEGCRISTQEQHRMVTRSKCNNALTDIDIEDLLLSDHFDDGSEDECSISKEDGVYVRFVRAVFSGNDAMASMDEDEDFRPEYYSSDDACSDTSSSVEFDSGDDICSDGFPCMDDAEPIADDSVPLFPFAAPDVGVNTKTFNVHTGACRNPNHSWSVAQYRQLYHQVHIHVQLLLQLYAICAKDPSEAACQLASQVLGMLQELRGQSAGNATIRAAHGWKPYSPELLGMSSAPSPRRNLTPRFWSPSFLDNVNSILDITLLRLLPTFLETMDTMPMADDSTLDIMRALLMGERLSKKQKGVGIHVLVQNMLFVAGRALAILQPHLDAALLPAPAPCVKSQLWSPAEDELLALGISRLGRDWRRIQQTYFPSKTFSQVVIRQKNVCARYGNAAVKVAKQRVMGPLTISETEKVQQGLAHFADVRSERHKWELISQNFLPHRTANQLQQLWKGIVADEADETAAMTNQLVTQAPFLFPALGDCKPPGREAVRIVPGKSQGQPMVDSRLLQTSNSITDFSTLPATEATLPTASGHKDHRKDLVCVRPPVDMPGCKDAVENVRMLGNVCAAVVQNGSGQGAVNPPRNSMASYLWLGAASSCDDRRASPLESDSVPNAATASRKGNKSSPKFTTGSKFGSELTSLPRQLESSDIVRKDAGREVPTKPTLTIEMPCGIIVSNEPSPVLPITHPDSRRSNPDASSRSNSTLGRLPLLFDNCGYEGSNSDSPGGAYDHKHTSSRLADFAQLPHWLLGSGQRKLVAGQSNQTTNLQRRVEAGACDSADCTKTELEQRYEALCNAAPDAIASFTSEEKRQAVLRTAASNSPDVMQHSHNEVLLGMLMGACNSQTDVGTMQEKVPQPCVSAIEVLHKLGLGSVNQLQPSFQNRLPVGLTSVEASPNSFENRNSDRIGRKVDNSDAPVTSNSKPLPVLRIFPAATRSPDTNTLTGLQKRQEQSQYIGPCSSNEIPSLPMSEVVQQLLNFQKASRDREASTGSPSCRSNPTSHAPQHISSNDTHLNTCTLKDLLQLAQSQGSIVKPSVLSMLAGSNASVHSSSTMSSGPPAMNEPLKSGSLDVKQLLLSSWLQRYASPNSSPVVQDNRCSADLMALTALGLAERNRTVSAAIAASPAVPLSTAAIAHHDSSLSQFQHQQHSNTSPVGHQAGSASTFATHLLQMLQNKSHSSPSHSPATRVSDTSASFEDPRMPFSTSALFSAPLSAGMGPTYRMPFSSSQLSNPMTTDPKYPVHRSAGTKSPGSQQDYSTMVHPKRRRLSNSASVAAAAADAEQKSNAALQVHWPMARPGAFVLPESLHAQASLAVAQFAPSGKAR